ncbi:MAG: hypothetical protein HYX38_31970 [Rhodospirillales bacterium]|nr:hypothetical protein [Rhodospirillales bacterium]
MHRLAVRLTVALALLLLGTGCAAAPSSRWQSRGDGTAPTVVDSADCRYQARRQAELRLPRAPPDSPSRSRAPSPSDVVADSDRFAAENGFYTQCMRQKGFELVDGSLRS